MEKEINPQNPFNLCTLDDASDCAGCSVKGKVVCKWDVKIRDNFRAIGFPPVLIPMFGMLIMGLALGVWWPLIVYPAYFMSMFSAFEIRFLCSHCPYYADNNKTLKCLANHGSPKFWKYHPEPMNKFERFMMSFGVIWMIFYIMPLAGLGYGIYLFAVNYELFGLLPLMAVIAIALGSLLVSKSFVSTLKTFYCPQCVNFSCPLNTVPKKTVDDYLNRNPVMREAWEKKGYVLDA